MTPDSDKLTHTDITCFRSDKPARSVVVVLPAMGVSASYYEPLAHAFNNEGIDCVLADWRGTGSSKQRASRKENFDYHTLVNTDIHAVINWTRQHYPQLPLITLGHSLGGQLSLLYAATHARRIDGAILVASGSVFFRAYPFPHDLKVFFGTQLFAAISKLIGYFPGHRIGFGGREARGVIADWAYQARWGKYRLGKSVDDVESELAKLSLPVLGVSIENDIMAPPGALAHLTGKLANATVTRRHLAKNAANANAADHFRWAREPAFVMDALLPWLAQFYPGHNHNDRHG
jgi:predicted alpha/beta hydrolase